LNRLPADDGCLWHADQSEAFDCSDGLDNDGDGFTDSPSDADCADANGVTERPEPSSTALLTSGIALLHWLWRRRKDVQGHDRSAIEEGRST
jgi:hypothetical protein